MRYLQLHIAALLSIFAQTGFANESFPQRNDTTTLEEITVTAIKQTGMLSQEPLSSTVIGSSEAENLNILTLKGISDLVPNFYIPDYGSRITSSIYVRGLGARMDQPVVGLNVDNVPFLNKDSYDFDISDIVRVEMIKGPQSTLYGRNTMCGQINVTTLSPLRFQGLRLNAEYGTGNTWRVGAGWYTRPRHNLGVAVLAGYNASSGFFRNLYNGKKIDTERNLSGRIKLDWNILNNLTLQNTLSVSNLNQGGYPYEYIKTGEINYNDTSFYRRFALNDGLTLRLRLPNVSISSITSFQYIDDNMTLDQDFLPIDYFTLTQKKKEWGVTQDFIARSQKSDGWYSWLAGLFGFYKHNDMQAPVAFGDVGIRTLIEDHRNSGNPSYPITWDSRNFVLNSDFDIPTYGLAAYHQSTFNIGERWHATVGLRLDYEHSSMQYRSNCNTGYTINHKNDETGSEEFYRHVDLNIDDRGNLSCHFLELLPKIALLYDLNDKNSNIYINVSKGYKAGGFNTQMFSDVLQQRLMSIMGIGGGYDIGKIVTYKPEKSLNYEIGTHLELFNGLLKSEGAFFYIDCRNQQLTMFPDGTTTGRIMTNAGKTRSFGVEASFEATPISNLTLNLSYGYTNARFREFNDGVADYKGKYIPYSPRHTIFAMAAWRLPVNLKLSNKSVNIDLCANVRGTGPIYWNESNTVKQNLYFLPGANITLSTDDFSLQFWGENLSKTKYSTFYFVSMKNEFLQRGKPLRVGVTFRYNLKI
jgi:outer membrane receptor protein involved in Fe transport